MPTTFTAIFLGNLPVIDPNEFNGSAENASSLVGMTFGGTGDSLVNDAVTWSAVGSIPGGYSPDNLNNTDQFSIDGGPAQTFDHSAIYSATITYIDGTTATITAVVAQDETGNTYLVPELSANLDQTALEAQAIRSLSLDTLLDDTFATLGSDRQTWDLVTCFTKGTRIRTDKGEVAIESLKPGDMVATVDNGFQPIRWVGSRTVPATGAFAPVLIKAGSMNNVRDLLVSQQHRMLVSGWRVEVNTGQDEALAPAKQLINGHDIVLKSGGLVTYYHLLFDQHELVWAEGSPSESFYPGTMGWNSLETAARQEILNLFPHLAGGNLAAYGASARPTLASFEVMASVA